MRALELKSSAPSHGETRQLPLLPVREMVLFPGGHCRLKLRRTGSRQLIAAARKSDGLLAIFAERYDTSAADGRELCAVGVTARIEKATTGGHAADPVVVEITALERIAVRRILSQEPFWRAEVVPLAEQLPDLANGHWHHSLETLRRDALRLLPHNDERRALLGSMKDPVRLVDLAAGLVDLNIEEKQDLLEETDVARRVRALTAKLESRLEVRELQRRVHAEAGAALSEGRRRDYLEEQLRVIRRELGENINEGAQLAAELAKRLAHAGVSEPAMIVINRELRRLPHLPASSAEFSTISEHIEVVCTMPWSMRSTDHLDLNQARQVLDESHYDLERVKRRLIEHIAVRQLNPEAPFPVICLIGPPGVGKSGLGRSLARAVGRQFGSLHLNGLRDEEEIVGLRCGREAARLGRVMMELQRLGTCNPVLMLEGVDELAGSGDTANALLEIIDPRQRKRFVDRYLNVPFDLSDVLVLLSARYLDDIPPLLREHLDVIRVSGYSDEEKMEIARRHLVPRQLKAHGLSAAQCEFEDGGIARLMEDYTREAGVRGLNREIGAMCRAAVDALVRAPDEKPIKVTPEFVARLIGPPRFLREARLATANPGVVTGLAWTSVGGEIMHIEALKYPGKGMVQLTGQIGTVMRESVHAAMSLIKSRTRTLDLNLNDILDSDLHVHVPAGAVPKDGPSAGVAMFTALASIFTQRSVRADIAMTGEITLRGLVLPVGGLKEKILAARHAGIPTIILPKLNDKDLADLPAAVREGLKLVLVETVDDVLAAALAPAQPPERPPRKSPRRKTSKAKPLSAAAQPASS
jgi:ATP-dependent Lon protease